MHIFFTFCMARTHTHTKQGTSLSFVIYHKRKLYTCSAYEIQSHTIFQIHSQQQQQEKKCFSILFALSSIAVQIFLSFSFSFFFFRQFFSFPRFISCKTCIFYHDEKCKVIFSTLCVYVNGLDMCECANAIYLCHFPAYCCDFFCVHWTFFCIVQKKNEWKIEKKKERKNVKGKSRRTQRVTNVQKTNGIATTRPMRFVSL